MNKADILEDFKKSMKLFKWQSSKKKLINGRLQYEGGDAYRFSARIEYYQDKKCIEANLTDDDLNEIANIVLNKHLGAGNFTPIDKKSSLKKAKDNKKSHGIYKDINKNVTYVLEFEIESISTPWDVWNTAFKNGWLLDGKMILSCIVFISQPEKIKHLLNNEEVIKKLEKICNKALLLEPIDEYSSKKFQRQYMIFIQPAHSAFAKYLQLKEIGYEAKVRYGGKYVSGWVLQLDGRWFKGDFGEYIVNLICDVLNEYDIKYSVIENQIY